MGLVIKKMDNPYWVILSKSRIGIIYFTRSENTYQLSVSQIRLSRSNK